MNSFKNCKLTGTPGTVNKDQQNNRQYNKYVEI